MKNPLVSIIVLNWNGEKWLKKCLPSLKKITYKSVEIIVVNNGSSDGSAAYIKRFHPKVKVIELLYNQGYARANNIGVSNALGEYVLLLNNDTTVEPNFLQPLVKKMEDRSMGMIQPQIRSMIYPQLLDSVCSYLTFNGFLYHFGYMKPYAKEIYKNELYGYSIKGAGFIMRKAEYIALGGFDEYFEYYVEETDLCHRVWLSGKKVLYFPESVMYHWGGGDMHIMAKSAGIMYRTFRNRITSYVKNLSGLNLALLLPPHLIFCEIFIIATLLKGDAGRAWGAQRGVFAAFLRLDTTLKKRKEIQERIRKVEDRDIWKYIFKNPRLSYYYYFFGNPKKYKD